MFFNSRKSIFLVNYYFKENSSGRNLFTTRSKEKFRMADYSFPNVCFIQPQEISSSEICSISINFLFYRLKSPGVRNLCEDMKIRA